MASAREQDLGKNIFITGASESNVLIARLEESWLRPYIGISKTESGSKLESRYGSKADLGCPIVQIYGRVPSPSRIIPYHSQEVKIRHKRVQIRTLNLYSNVTSRFPTKHRFNEWVLLTCYYYLVVWFDDYCLVFSSDHSTLQVSLISITVP